MEKDIMDSELAYSSATDILRLISTKQISPVDITELYFNRIEKLDSQLNSYLLLTRDYAMQSAKKAETAVMNGDELGALHGLPISIKDSQMTKGFRTTNGSPLLKDRIPERNEAVVDRVLDAGAIMLGKTNVSELALTGTCENLLGAPGCNPWNTECTPGGSSGGSAAAVAAYLCSVATGGDGGGSIRIPASFCGIYGIRPTQGRVSGYSGVDGPPMPDMFSQSGPLSRTVRDSALLLQVLAGYDSRDSISLREEVPDFIAAVDRDVKGLRIAWSPDYGFANVEPEVLNVTHKAALAFEDLGCHVEECSLRLEPPYDLYGPILDAHFYDEFGRYMKTDADQLMGCTKLCIERGANVTATDYAKTLGLMDRLKSKMTDLFEKYDLLLSPVLCFTAFKNGEYPGSLWSETGYPEQYLNGTFTLQINTIGHPAASIPAGFSSDGMPVGLHIVGRKGDEETVIAASAAFERARPWIQHRPAVS